MWSCFCEDFVFCGGTLENAKVFKWLSLNDAVDGHQLQLPGHFLFESACTSVLILCGQMR